MVGRVDHFSLRLDRLVLDVERRQLLVDCLHRFGDAVGLGLPNLRLGFCSLDLDSRLFENLRRRKLVGDRIRDGLRILNIADDDADDCERRALGQLQNPGLHRGADAIDVFLDVQAIVFLNLVARVGSERLLDEIVIGGGEWILARLAIFLDECLDVLRIYLPQQMRPKLDAQIVLR
jgi:hypothetical protein